MTKRFSTDHRSSWRARFLAIARELEGHGPQRRERFEAAAQGNRARFVPPRLWRGVRLACRAS